MRIGPVLSRAFKGMKSGPLWGFFATAVIACAVPVVLVAVASRFVITPALLAPIDLGTSEDVRVLVEMFRLYAALGLGMLLALPFIIVLQAGLIHLTDNLFAGRPLSVGEGWSFGWRHFGRTLGVEALLFFAYMIAITMAMLPFIAIVFAGAAAGQGENPAGLFGGVCLGYIWLFLAMTVVVLAYMAVRSLALRYALIGGRAAADAISAGYKALRHAFKPVALFTLVMLGIMYGYQTVTSFVTMPAYFLGMIPAISSEQPDPAAIMSLMWIIYPLYLLLYLPMTLFNALAWTSYFRMLTGIDPVPPAVTYGHHAMPQPAYPPAPQPPAPPAPDAPAPQPPAPQPPAPDAPAPQPPAPDAPAPQPPASPATEPQAPDA